MKLLEFLPMIVLFSCCIAIYGAVFALVCAAWGLRSDGLRRAALWLFFAGLALHGWGICARMILHGYPPVTDLYSSAVFIGWGAALSGLLLEHRLRDGLSLAGASFAGFAALCAAHGIAGPGTPEALQAVLNTRFWLIVHVLTISLGYCAILLAGGLAAVSVLREALGGASHRADARHMEAVLLAVIRFGVGFATAGTLLGGIWADQCWGRFWGWDPKENGALLVVLWYAAILHAWRSGNIRRRGLLGMTLLGDALTAFSWFGINMLGVGLHSYGSLGQTGWPWLGAWISCHCALALLAALPLRRWRVLCQWNARAQAREAGPLRVLPHPGFIKRRQ